MADSHGGEQERLGALRRLGILGTDVESYFDDIARVAALACGTPMALVSLVDADRQWFKARVGVDLLETPRHVSFCAHAIARDADVFEVPDAVADPRFTHNALVRGPPNIRFYAGAPVQTEGQRVGTLCVLDNRPGALTDEKREILLNLKRLVERGFEMRRANLLLVQHRLESEMTQQFIAHDIKNPLSVVTSSASFLLEEPSISARPSLAEAARDIVEAGQLCATRLNQLLDFSKADVVEDPSTVDLAELLSSVQRLFERRASDKQQQLTVAATVVSTRVECNSLLLRRVVENLVSNAVNYSPPNGRIRLDCTARSGMAELRVEDSGPGIPFSERERIFEFGVRLNAPDQVQGHGIGLAMVKSALQAMRGSVHIETSELGGTAFVLRIPVLATR